MSDKPDLVALLGSRICHDLISPLGAIGNGVELLTMSANASGPELTLISDSVANASARIRFFRIAFGASSPGQRIGRPEIAGILSDLTRQSKLKINWPETGDLPRAEVRLAFLLILCLETAMAFGGTITLLHDEDGWSIVATADRMKIDPELWGQLQKNTPDVDLSAAHVHFALVPGVATEIGRTVAAELNDRRIVVTF